MSQPKAIQADITKMVLGEDGCTDFTWPVALPEMYAFIEDILFSHLAILREEERAGSSVLTFRLLSKTFLPEVVGVFQAFLLRERSKKNNLTIDVPSSWRLWPAVFSGESLPKSPILESLRCGPQKQSVAKRLINFKRITSLLRRMVPRRGGVAIDGLKIAPITEKRLKNDIVATQRTSLISFHAGQIKGKDVVLVNSARWFSPLRESDLSQGEEVMRIGQKILADVKRAFDKWGVPFDGVAKDYLSDLLFEGEACLRAHYERLIRNPEKLPRHIWTGTGGNTWDSLLRLAVMETGGIAEGHDHSLGSAACDLPITCMTELWGCNRFITFTPPHVQAYLGAAQKIPAFKNSATEITAIHPAEAKADIRACFVPGRASKKTVIFVSPIYDRDRGRLFPMMADPVRADWEARLISHCTAWGYHVIVKPHPESPLLPPEVFSDKLGATISDKRFEEIMEQADVVLFDFVLTTPFRSVLETDVPVAVIDFGEISWNDDGRKLVEDRCEFVSGRFDDRNRANVDWDALQRALERAAAKSRDRKFADAYFS